MIAVYKSNQELSKDAQDIARIARLSSFPVWYTVDTFYFVIRFSYVMFNYVTRYYVFFYPV